MFASLFLAAAAAAATTASAAQPQIVCRVRDLGNGPKIYVDGKTEPHHWIWVRDTIRNQPLSTEWKTFDIAVRSPVDVKGCGLWLRTDNESGKFEARGIRIVGSDGSVHPATSWYVPHKEHRPYVSWSATNGCGTLAMDFTPAATGGTNVLLRHSLELFSNRTDFKGGVTYRIQMEARGEGIASFHPAIHPGGDPNYHAWMEEVPAVDGDELSSCVQVAMAGRNGAHVVTYAAPSCWYDGKDDFTAAIEQAKRFLKANPNALLVPRISLDVPPWWFKKHPGEKVVLHTDKTVDARHGNISSEVYRRESMDYLAKYIRALQEAFPRNFAGVHPGMQNTAECFYPESWSKMCGYDPHTLREWRRWLKAKGAADWETAEVPRPEDRRRPNGESRVFDVSDPVQARCVEFARFQQTEMVRFIRDVCHVCRTVTEGKKLVLVFYGYTWEFASVHQGPAATGHYGVGHLLETIGDDLDIVSSPLSYDVDRRFCGSTPLMHAAETFMRHGILPVYEDDSRTHLDPRKAEAVQEGVTMNAHETIEMLTRNKGVLAVRGFESWWMDLTGQSWFADENIWKICRDLRAADLANANRAKAYAPPVALIHDEESMLRIDFGGKNIFAPLSRSSRRVFARTGAGFGQYLLSDVAARPLDAKLQVHLSSWALDEKTVERLVADRATRSDVTRVWCGLPGCLTDRGLDVAAGERLTGFRLRRAAVKMPKATATEVGRARGLPETLVVRKEEFFYEAGTTCDTLLTVEPAPGDEVWATWEDGSPAIVARKNAGGDGLNVYYGVNVFDWQTASALVRAAGVFSHLAANDGETALSASERLLVLQAQTDGRREIVYPKATKILDVREKKTLDASDRFAFDLKKGDVKVLLVLSGSGACQRQK
jgi:beta-galactosidase